MKRSGPSSSSLSMGQLTRSTVSSLSLSQLSLASSSVGCWGSTESRKAYCDLSVFNKKPEQKETMVRPSAETIEEEDWGFFVDTYDRPVDTSGAPTLGFLLQEETTFNPTTIGFPTRRLQS